MNIFESIRDSVKKEVASQKQTKKLRKERDDAVQELNSLKARFEAVSSELSVYKKKEEDNHYFSREKMVAEGQRIRREEQLSSELKRARAFISDCGLADEFEHYRNNRHRSSELE